MIIPSYRSVNIAQALASIFLIVVAILYFENHLGLEPCYLCITQRFFVICIGLICAVAALHNPAQFGQRVYAALSILCAILGGYFSSKQLWLQSLPEDQVPACGIPVDYLLDSFSLSEAIAMLVRGDGNCAGSTVATTGIKHARVGIDWVYWFYFIGCNAILAQGLGLRARVSQLTSPIAVGS